MTMKIKGEFPDYFRAIQVKFSRFYAAALNKADLSISQYALLNHLVSSGSTPMCEIGEKLHVTKPAVTHLVDKLEKAKFLKRISHPTDRRVSLLKVLPKGVRVVKQIQEKVLGIVGHALHEFKPAEQKIILRYHSLISEVIDQVLNESEV